MAKCDLCGKTTSALELEQLIDGLRVPGVTDICRDCANWVTKVRAKEISESIQRTRCAIAARAKIPRRWWHWFLNPRPREKELSDQLAAVTAQRDELLAAVKSAKSWLEGWASADQEIAILDMAIAKCGGDDNAK